MRFLFLSALATVMAACSTAGILPPVGVGMPLDDYSARCAAQLIVETWGSKRIGECADRPDEYVVLEDGKIVDVMSSTEFKSAWQAANCDAAPCRERIDRMFAEREVRKRRIAAETGR